MALYLLPLIKTFYTEGCAMPSIPSFVRVDEEITDFHRAHGSFLHFHCIPGYSMTEGGVSEVKCWFGEWTFPPPTCVPGKKISSIIMEHKYTRCNRTLNYRIKYEIFDRVIMDAWHPIF